ncbi:MAG: Asp-tRNA(Asn)/Glu-tRNA(Gln) amidotransferase subunit GatB [Candidatus Aenigmatarchaeota archaeon]
MEMKVGLEIHVQLKTKEKLFCKCSSEYRDKKPNENICPICTGQPGSKPMNANLEAIKNLLKIGLILNCEIVRERIRFLRKHYFYPDLPKNYQITSEPIMKNGNFFGIRIREIHLEEDPGRYDLRNGYVDFNRSGIPLAEIVTEPDFNSIEQIEDWLDKFYTFLKFSNSIVEDPGSIRIDVNISTKGERVEIKNVTGIKNVIKAIKYELLRQERSLKIGKEIKRETRHFDEEKKITVPLREKEYVEDYRYIPEPDLPSFKINEELINEVKKDLIIVSEEEKKLKEVYKINEEYIKKIIKNPVLLISINKIFENVKKDFNKIAELITDYVYPICGDKNINLLNLLEDNNFLENLEEIVENLDKIDRKKLREIVEVLISGKNPIEYAKEKNYFLEGVSEEEIKKVIEMVINEEKEAIEDYKKGNAKAINYLIGKTIQKLKKRVDVKIIDKFLREFLSK